MRGRSHQPHAPPPHCPSLSASSQPARSSPHLAPDASRPRVSASSHQVSVAFAQLPGRPHHRAPNSSRHAPAAPHLLPAGPFLSAHVPPFPFGLNLDGMHAPMSASAPPTSLMHLSIPWGSPPPMRTFSLQPAVQPNMSAPAAPIRRAWTPSVPAPADAARQDALPARRPPNRNPPLPAGAVRASSFEPTQNGLELSVQSAVQAAVDASIPSAMQVAMTSAVQAAMESAMQSAVTSAMKEAMATALRAEMAAKDELLATLKKRVYELEEELEWQEEIEDEELLEGWAQFDDGGY